MNQEADSSSDATQSEAPAPETPPPAPSSVDLSSLPLGVLRILRDPGGSLEALHKPGSTALAQGLILGLSSVILIPVVQLIFAKLLYGQALSITFGHLLRQCLGGVVFLAIGSAVGFAFLQTSREDCKKDWKNAVYAMGSSLVFLLAGVVAGGVFVLFKSEFFAAVALACAISGTLLAAFTYYGGLLKPGGLSSQKAIWTVVAAFAAAFLLGSLLDFNAVTVVPNVQIDMGAFQRETQRTMQDMLRELGR